MHGKGVGSVLDTFLYRVKRWKRLRYWHFRGFHDEFRAVFFLDKVTGDVTDGSYDGEEFYANGLKGYSLMYDPFTAVLWLYEYSS